MKKRRNKFFDIRVQFFFICMAGFIGVALLAALAAWGLEHLGVNVPIFVWLLIFTLLLGSATAAGFSIAFFAPISRLSRAMKEVASRGDCFGLARSLITGSITGALGLHLGNGSLIKNHDRTTTDGLL